MCVCVCVCVSTYQLWAETVIWTSFHPCTTWSWGGHNLFVAHRGGVIGQWWVCSHDWWCCLGRWDMRVKWAGQGTPQDYHHPITTYHPIWLSRRCDVQQEPWSRNPSKAAVWSALCRESHLLSHPQYKGDALVLWEVCEEVCHVQYGIHGMVIHAWGRSPRPTFHTHVWEYLREYLLTGHARSDTCCNYSY